MPHRAETKGKAIQNKTNFLKNVLGQAFANPCNIYIGIPHLLRLSSNDPPDAHALELELFIPVLCHDGYHGYMIV